MRKYRILVTGALCVLSAAVGLGIGGGLRGLSPAETLWALGVLRGQTDAPRQVEPNVRPAPTPTGPTAPAPGAARPGHPREPAGQLFGEQESPAASGSREPPLETAGAAAGAQTSRPDDTPGGIVEGNGQDDGWTREGGAGGGRDEAGSPVPPTSTSPEAPPVPPSGGSSEGPSEQPSEQPSEEPPEESDEPSDVPSEEPSESPSDESSQEASEEASEDSAGSSDDSEEAATPESDLAGDHAAAAHD